MASCSLQAQRFVNVFNDYAGMAAFNPGFNTNVFVAGGVTLKDGLQGVFTFVAGSTSAAISNEVIVGAGAAGRWFRQSRSTAGTSNSIPVWSNLYGGLTDSPVTVSGTNIALAGTVSSGGLLYLGTATNGHFWVGDGTSGKPRPLRASDIVSAQTTSPPDNYLLRDWTAKLSSIQLSNTTTAVIAAIGDSWMAQDKITGPLRLYLNNRFGDGGVGFVGACTNQNLNSPLPPGVTRTVLGTWAATNNSLLTFGVGLGDMTSSDIATPGTISFVGTCSSYVIHYIKQSGGGSFTYKTDGGAGTTVITTNASSILGTVTVSGLSDASHTVLLTVTVAGTTGVKIIGIDFHRPGPGVRMNNIGVEGTTTANWLYPNATQWEAGLTALAPNLVTIMLGVNDANSAVTQADYFTNLTNLITRVQTAMPLADVVLLTPCDIGGVSTMSNYVAMLQSVATTMGVGFVDFFSVMGPYTAANTRGNYANVSHLNAQGGAIVGSYWGKYLNDGRAFDVPPGRLAIGTMDAGADNLWVNGRIGIPSSNYLLWRNGLGNGAGILDTSTDANNDVLSFATKRAGSFTSRLTLGTDLNMTGDAFVSGNVGISTASAGADNLYINGRVGITGGNFIVWRNGVANGAGWLSTDVDAANTILSGYARNANSFTEQLVIGNGVKVNGLTVSKPVYTSGTGYFTSSGFVSLTSDVSGILPVGNGGTGTGTTFMQGSVVFAGASAYTQDPSNFTWDITNHRLSIGAVSGLDNLWVNGRVGVAGGNYVLWRNGVANGAGILSADTDSANTILSISTRSANSFAERMRVAANGNVGLGTTTPLQQLAVNGQGLFLASTIGTDPGDASGAAVRAGYLSTFDYGYVEAINSGVATKQLMLNPNGGSVGINKTNAAAALDVTGSILASVNMSASGFVNGALGLKIGSAAPSGHYPRGDGTYFIDSTGVPATDLTGTIVAARMPALTGDITSTVGTVATIIANNAVTLDKMADISTASVIGRNTAGTGDPEVLTTLPSGVQANITTVGTLSAGAVPTTLLTGTLQAAQFPALTGDITTASGTLATTLKNTGTAGTYTKVTFDAQGRETSGTTADLSTADVTGILAGARFPALTGDVTTMAGALATTLATTQTGVHNWTGIQTFTNSVNLPNVGNTKILGTDGSGNIAALSTGVGVTNISGTLSANYSPGSNVTFTTNSSGNVSIASAAGGAGTVTSVGLSLPSIITVSGSPVTTSGTLTGTLATQTANTIFAGPTSGAAAQPTFRSLTADDIASSGTRIVKSNSVNVGGTGDTTIFTTKSSGTFIITGFGYEYTSVSAADLQFVYTLKNGAAAELSEPLSSTGSDSVVGFYHDLYPVDGLWPTVAGCPNTASSTTIVVNISTATASAATITFYVEGFYR